MKTKNVLFNIITRASRKNYFKICYDSIHSQTYKKFRHIVTYETEEMREYLEQFDDLVLVKVPHKRKIPGLSICSMYNPSTEDYLNPDYDFLDYKVLNREETWEENIYKKDRVKVKQISIDTPTKDGINKWFVPPEAWRQYYYHLPYNLYLKIAEKEFQDGWVIYIDDDDQLFESTTLEKLNKTIIDYGTEDVLHINQWRYPNGDLIPNEHYSFLYSHDFPFVYGQISGLCLLFHTKYADYTCWDEWNGADFKTAVSLKQKIGKVNMTHVLIAELTDGPNFGSLEDKK